MDSRIALSLGCYVASCLPLLGMFRTPSQGSPMKSSLRREALPSPRFLSRDVVGRSRRAASMFAFTLIAALPLSAATPITRELPDTRTWQFFGEKKLRSRLFFSVPGVSDSNLVSDDPACCPIVSPSGRWVACTNFNRKAIESELLILSRQAEQWRPLPGYTMISYQWSPDGLSLAGYGKRRTAASVCFFAVQPATKSAWFPDSLSVPEDYEFAWDSTSSRVAICRPGSDSRNPARVLILTLPSRKVGTVATLNDGEPTNPRWLPDGSLLVAKQRGGASDSSTDLRFTLPGR
jgi:hypothetical protein